MGIFIYQHICNSCVTEYNRLNKLFYNKKNKKLLFEENILEVSFSKNKIRRELEKLFRNVKVIDFDEKDEKRKDMRLYFICKK